MLEMEEPFAEVGEKKGVGVHVYCTVDSGVCV